MKRKYFQFILILLVTTVNIHAQKVYNVVWIDQENVSTDVYGDTNGTLLEKKGPSGWNAGAASLNILPANDKGYVEYEAEETETFKMFGLSYSAGSSGYSNIDYAIYLRGGEIQIYESGNRVGNYNQYETTYVFRVERNRGEIIYSVNGKILKATPLGLNDENKEMIVDISLHTPNAPMNFVKASFPYTDLSLSSHIVERTKQPDMLYADATGASGNYQYEWDNGHPLNNRAIDEYGEYSVTVTDESGLEAKAKIPVFADIEWIDLTNVSVNGNSIVKTNSNGWNAGAASRNKLDPGENGFVEYHAEETSKYKMFGLSYNNANASLSTIHYALYCRRGELRVYESGSYKATYGSYSVNDKLVVKRESGYIRYYRNDQLLRSVSIGSSNQNKEMIVDFSIASSGGKFTDMQCTFGNDLNTQLTTSGGPVLFIIAGETHGGKPPYSFSWNTGETTTSVSNKEYGRYILTVTDNWGKTEVTSVSLEISGDKNQNYVHSISPRKPVNNESALDAIEKIEKYNYFDGLGRTMQTIAVGISPSGKDVIQPIKYDAYGRQAKDYLPYTINSNGGYREHAFLEQENFYSEARNNGKFAYTAFPYAEKVFDNSPLNRVIEQGSPGKIWQPEFDNTIKSDLATNTTNEVRFWYMDGNNNCLSDDYYDNNELFVNIVTDENNNQVKKYTDKRGNIVLKKSQDGKNWLETYYVYDDFNLLRYVIMPGATKGGMFTDFDHCFYYEYDERHRMIKKQIPGAKEVYMVYDNLDRLVFSQDGNLREDHNKWMYNIYDNLNRPVKTCIFNNPANYSHDYLIYLVENSSFTTNASQYDVYTETWYDNYDFPEYNDYKYQRIDDFDVEPFMRVIGKVAHTKTYVPDLKIWLYSVIYYDKYNRVIQTISDNHIGGKDVVCNKYNFSGEIVKTMKIHNYEGPNKVIITERYDYDHAGRLLNTQHQVNDQDPVIASAMEYNELGEMNIKKMHSENEGQSWLQETDYAYNIRGWLTKINNSRLKSKKFNDDLFGMELNYVLGLTGYPWNEAKDALDYKSDQGEIEVENQFNGNITAMQWRSAKDDITRGFAYSYDSINRLNKAEYASFDMREGWILENNYYTVKDISYDKNGNITELKRSGLLEEDKYGSIDLLQYTYDGNKLTNVYDYCDSDNGQGFVDGNSSFDQEYFYDANGNLEKDLNKEIEKIKHNYLNLPVQIDFAHGNQIKYIYDANGAKLRKEVYESGNLISYREYVGGFEYDADGLELIHTGDGRLVPKEDNSLRYEYFLRDHLGNVRVTFTDDNNDGTPEVLSESSYYPFGLSFNNYVSGNNLSTNLYKYNGKEEQNDHTLSWIDYGGRANYAPAIARFQSIDPMAEIYNFQSPFAYAANNPIRFIDYNGLGPGDRVKYAQNAVSTDTRTYGNQDNYALKISDNYVDCSEFAMEVALGDGINLGSYYSADQANYFKNNGEWVTDASNVRKGDFIYWSKKEGGTITHTGVVTDIDKDGNLTIMQSSGNNGGESINETTTNTNGDLWAGSKWERHFVGAGRPEGELYKGKDFAEITKTAIGYLSKKLSSIMATSVESSTSNEPQGLMFLKNTSSEYHDGRDLDPSQGGFY